MTLPRNRALCATCKSIIESLHGHDFVRCACGAIALDGGRGLCQRQCFDDARNVIWLGDREPTPEELAAPSPVTYGWRTRVVGPPFYFDVRETVDAALEDAVAWIQADERRVWGPVAPSLLTDRLAARWTSGPYEAVEVFKAPLPDC